MMSDLAEIAAAAGITIIDEDDADEKVSVEAENLYGTKEQVSDELTAAEQIVQGQIHDWDVAFSDRYTMNDPGYAYTIEAGDVTQQQPCVVGFACFRQRDDRRNWDRNRRGGYRGRGGSSWNRGDSGDSGSWNRQENSRYQPHNYGDHQHRGYGSQHNRSDSNERRSWGNSNDQDRAYGHHQSREGREGYQNRGNVNYQGRQEQQNQHSSNNTGDRWNRSDVQGNKDSSRGGGRDRSTQR